MHGSVFHIHDCDCGCGQGGCWHEYPERGWIQFLILRFLYEAPAHGYRLLELLEEKSGGLYRLEAGSIYTLLRRMERRGLIESEWEQGEGSRPERRVYRVTEAGVEALKSGLRAVLKRRELIDDLVAFYEKNFAGGG
jgi:DNA-binding PadR family transcriptional regulator